MAFNPSKQKLIVVSKSLHSELQKIRDFEGFRSFDSLIGALLLNYKYNSFSRDRLREDPFKRR